jgi:hypothetical protein
VKYWPDPPASLLECPDQSDSSYWVGGGGGGGAGVVIFQEDGPQGVPTKEAVCNLRQMGVSV